MCRPARIHSPRTGIGSTCHGRNARLTSAIGESRSGSDGGQSTAGRGVLGTNKAIQIELMTAKPLCIIAITLLVLAGPASSCNAQTLTTLYSFKYGTGGYPGAGLIQGGDGNFYGTTTIGGTNGGYGTVFRINSCGTFTSLYSFSGSDGSQPWSRLIQGRDGSLYGTTLLDGANGSGTVFRITFGGSLTNLQSFGGGSDGAKPAGVLLQTSDGDFYGTTYSGGTYNSGTVFKINTNGNRTNLWAFSGGSDGANPFGGLVQGGDGSFYGTASGGGTNNDGTIFRISPSGNLTTLHAFNGSDGASPDATLVQGSDGNFYGTTYIGGTKGGTGTVFRIGPGGNFTNLYSFSGTDGAYPQGGLIQGSDGSFFGTTEEGGMYSFGTLFRITLTGGFTNLYSFSGLSDGGATIAGLVQGSDGIFYGITWLNLNVRPPGFGTMFSFVIPLNPPANQISALQLAGTNVVLAIPSVAGETYQLQFTTDLTSGIWSNVPGASVTNSIGALMTLTNFGGVSSQGFYRFAITP